MDPVVYEFNQLQVVNRGDKYFVRYDAGSLQEVWREDEISEEELQRLKSGQQGLYEVILGIQRRLGPDAYKSNWAS